MSLALEKAGSINSDTESKENGSIETNDESLPNPNPKTNIGIFICGIIANIILLIIIVIFNVISGSFIGSNPSKIAPIYIQMTGYFGLTSAMIIVFIICIYVAKYVQPVIAEFNTGVNSTVDESNERSERIAIRTPSVDQDTSTSSCAFCIKCKAKMAHFVSCTSKIFDKVPVINANFGFLRNKHMTQDSLISEHQNNGIIVVLKQYVKLSALIMILKELPVFVMAILKIVYSEDDDISTPLYVLIQRSMFFFRLIAGVLITPRGGIRKNIIHQRIWGQMCHPDHALFVIPLMRIIQMKSFPIYTNMVTISLTGTHQYKSDWDVMYGAFNVFYCGLGLLMALKSDFNSYELLCLCKKKLRNEEIELLLNRLRKYLKYFGVFQFYDVTDVELDFMRENRLEESPTFGIPKLLYVYIALCAVSVILMMIAAFIIIAS